MRVAPPPTIYWVGGGAFLLLWAGKQALCVALTRSLGVASSPVKKRPQAMPWRGNSVFQVLPSALGTLCDSDQLIDRTSQKSQRHQCFAGLAASQQLY